MPRLPTRSRRGAATLEFALCAPVLVTVAAGVADWGWYLSRESQMVEVVRDAARSGASAPTGTAPATLAQSRATESLTALGFDPAETTITATLSTDAVLGGQVLRLEVSAPYTPLVGLVSTADNLAAVVTMPVVK